MVYYFINNSSNNITQENKQADLSFSVDNIQKFLKTELFDVEIA
jgi:hypothetical protein